MEQTPRQSVAGTERSVVSGLFVPEAITLDNLINFMVFNDQSPEYNRKRQALLLAAQNRDFESLEGLEEELDKSGASIISEYRGDAKGWAIQGLLMDKANLWREADLPRKEIGELIDLLKPYRNNDSRHKTDIQLILENALNVAFSKIIQEKTEQLE
jgi:hypothetical protein